MTIFRRIGVEIVIPARKKIEKQFFWKLLVLYVLKTSENLDLDLVKNMLI